MVDKKSIPQTEQDNNPLNHVGANDNVQLPDNSNVGGYTNTEWDSTRLKNVIASEELRRKLFKYAVITSLIISSCMYSALIYWIYKRAQLPYIFGGNSEVWHIATILALPPTTILFLLIKVLSSKEEQSNKNDSNLMPINIKDMPVNQWIAQTKTVIEGIVEAIKGKK